MIIQEAVRKLMSYDNAHVKELARLIDAIEEELTANRISQTEYVDLMVDVERLRMIIQEAQDLALDQLIHEAIEGLIHLAEMAKP